MDIKRQRQKGRDALPLGYTGCVMEALCEVKNAWERLAFFFYVRYTAVSGPAGSIEYSGIVTADTSLT